MLLPDTQLTIMDAVAFLVKNQMVAFNLYKKHKMVKLAWKVKLLIIKVNKPLIFYRIAFEKTLISPVFKKNLRKMKSFIFEKM